MGGRRAKEKRDEEAAEVHMHWGVIVQGAQLQAGVPALFWKRRFREGDGGLRAAAALRRGEIQGCSPQEEGLDAHVRCCHRGSVSLLGGAEPCAPSRPAALPNDRVSGW